MKEVLEVTRKIFPLSKNKEDTFLGGISMGGYGALKYGMIGSDQFGKIAALSPGIYVDKIMKGNPQIFPGGMFEEIFKSYLDKLGIKPEYQEDEGNHDVLYWEKILGDVFDFLRKDE